MMMERKVCNCTVNFLLPLYDFDYYIENDVIDFVGAYSYCPYYPYPNTITILYEVKDKVLAQLKRHDINISYDELSKRLMISNDDYYRWIELIQILRLLPEDASKSYVMSKLLDFVILNHVDNIKSIKHDTELYAIRLNSEVHII